MLAIRVYKDCDTKKVLAYSMINEHTLTRVSLDYKALISLYKQGSRSVNNIELDSYGNLRLCNANPKVKRKYYHRTFVKNTIIEHYAIITSVRHGLLSFVADGIDNNIISAQDVTLSEIANLLGISIDDLRFYNAYIEKTSTGKTEINIYNRNTGYYKTIIESSFKIGNSELGDYWKAVEIKADTNGLVVIGLDNIRGDSQASLPNSIYHLESFYGGVNHLTLPFSIKTLGYGCFKELEDLISLKINEGLKVIPKQCCMESLLEAISIPNSVEIIDDQAFQDCYKLRSPLVCMPKYIGRQAFSGTKIPIVNLDHTEKIDTEAFADNNRLRKVKLNEGLKIIGHGAFRWCTALEEIKIPSTVELIGKKAFEGCNKLKIVRIALNKKDLKIAKDAFSNKVKIEYY